MYNFEYIMFKFKISWTLRLALRYISDRKRERWISISAFLTAGGLLLGVAVLIIILSVMQGFRDSLLDKMLSMNGHISILAKISDEELKAIQSLPEVQKAFRMTQKQIMMTVEKPGMSPQIFGAIIRAMPEKELRSFLSKNFKYGSIDDMQADEGLCLGSKISQEYGINIGDKVLLTSPDQITTPFGEGIPSIEVDVSAVFNFGMTYYDSAFCFMTKESFDTLNLPAIEPVFIFLKDPYKSQSLKEKLKNTSYYNYINEWQSQDITFVQVLTVQKNVMFIVISLMILIAAFNGVSSLFMLVKEKSKEIAILRVLGSTKKEIRSIFLYIGLLISSVSITLGVILGVSVALTLDYIRLFFEKLLGVDLFPAEFYQMTKIPVYLDFWQIIMVAFWCLALIMLVLLYPIQRSMKVDPDYELREL